LEIIVSNERRQVHEREFRLKEMQREIEEVKAERDRHLLRIQSLQNHIESLQKYGKGTSSHNSSMLENSRVVDLEEQLH